MTLPAAVVDANPAELLSAKHFVLKAAVMAAAFLVFSIGGTQVFTGRAHTEGSSRALLQDLIKHSPQSQDQRRALLHRQGAGRAHELTQRVGSEYQLRLFREIQSKATLIVLCRQALQIALLHQRADGLRGRPASRPVVLREGAHGTGKSVGAFEIAQGRPLGGMQTGAECLGTGTASKLLNQLGHLDAQGHGEILGRVELLPVPFVCELLKASLQFVEVQVVLLCEFHWKQVCGGTSDRRLRKVCPKGLGDESS